MFNHSQNYKVKCTLSFANQFGCKDTIFLRNMQGVKVIIRGNCAKMMLDLLALRTMGAAGVVYLRR